MFDIYKTLQAPIYWGLEKVQDYVPALSTMHLLSPKNISTLALAAQVVFGVEVEKGNFDVLKYVDPLIGTSEGGKSRSPFRYLFQLTV
jgi:hypothetical protein